jgi:hypothetical protein
MSDPRILGPSGLTGRYYFSRDYVDHGGGHVVTRTKYDVSADVEAIIAEALKQAAAEIRSGLDTTNRIGEGVEFACRMLDVRAAHLRGEETGGYQGIGPDHP